MINFKNIEIFNIEKNQFIENDSHSYSNSSEEEKQEDHNKLTKPKLSHTLDISNFFNFIP